MDHLNHESHPQKRVKLDPGVEAKAFQSGQNHVTPTEDNSSTPMMASSLGSDESMKELEVGIIAFVDDSRATFRGILKKRYTDFLVNEILPDGKVLHLQETTPKQVGSTGSKVHVVDPATVSRNSQVSSTVSEVKSAAVQEPAPKEVEENESEIPSSGISDGDRSKLVEYFSQDAALQLVSLFESILRNPEKKPRDHPVVRTSFTSDRSIRSQIHQDIRRIFNGKIDSSTDPEGILVLTAVARKNNQARQWAKPTDKGRPGKQGWVERGGDFVHFTLYKENKDTLEVISFLTHQLKTNNKTFQFAGTKDRRAVTVQRVSAYRIDAGRLATTNRVLRYAAVGDFEYQTSGLELGDLSGNEFVLTLRDCNLVGSDLAVSDPVSAARTYLSTSLQGLREKGFLNYYGLQRFGTFATRTDVVGVKILKGDFQGACDAILNFSPTALQSAESLGSNILVGQDDRARAEGINIWRTSGRINAALDKIPRKFSAETTLVRQLGKQPRDFLGALLSIQRNLRLMYVHAYQSLVWNLAVGERWRLFGNTVVEGDLVLVREHKNKTQEEEVQTVDADGEIIIQPSGEDRAYDPDDAFERARALTAAEAATGLYSMFDLVLPLPGFDVVYPANASGEWYKTFMASEAGGGLDPYDMRRKQKDFSLSGGYRKILARIGADFEVQIHPYVDGNQQFVETDMDRLKSVQKGEAEGKDGDGDGAVGLATNGKRTDDISVQSDPQAKLAAVLKFQLGSSQYATMALRELSRGGIQAHKADFMGGR